MSASITKLTNLLIPAFEASLAALGDCGDLHLISGFDIASAVELKSQLTLI